MPIELPELDDRSEYIMNRVADNVIVNHLLSAPVYLPDGDEPSEGAQLFGRAAAVVWDTLGLGEED